MIAAPKFTPWRRCGRVVEDATCNAIAIVNVAMPEQEAHALADFFAAAPDLYAACLAVEDAQRGGDYETAFKAVRAALARVASAAYQRDDAIRESDIIALLGGSHYMDPPDGGDVSLLEQLRRMAEDAAKWRKSEAAR